MSIIKLRCSDQVMAFENTPVISSGGMGEDFVEFSFCSQWDGYAVTAVFWRTEDDVYHAVLDGANRCAIPPEVTAEPGIIYFGVFGVNPDALRRTSEVVSYRITRGSITNNTKPSDATPEVYDQLLAKYAEVLAALDPAEGMVKDAAASAAAAEATLAAMGTEVADARKSADAAAASADAAQKAATDSYNNAAVMTDIAQEARDAAYYAQQYAANAVPTTRKVNGLALSEDINLTPDNINAVPNTRMVNGKALSADIELNAGDVGAAPESHSHAPIIGTYTGNGSAAARTITTGGAGNLLTIWSDESEQVVFVTPRGGLVVGSMDLEGNAVVQMNRGVSYADGVLTIAAKSRVFNYEGQIYKYQAF